MTRRPHSGRLALTALLISGAFLACETNLTEVTDAVGPPSFNFNVGAQATRLPSGSVSLGTASVTFTVQNLRALAAGQYQFWAVGPDDQNLDVPVQLLAFKITENFTRVDTLADGSPNIDPVTGDTIYVADSRVINDTTAARVTGYAGSDDPFVTSADLVLDQTGDGSDPTTYNSVVVTLETTAGASTPGDAQFLWRRIGVSGGGNLAFGHFGGGDTLATSMDDYAFVLAGSGLGGARGAELSVDFLELPRPPVGFYYAGYLVDGDGNGVLADTLRSGWSLDSTVSRVNLYAADVDAVVPDIVGNDIRRSQVRNCASGSLVTSCQNTMALPVDSTFAGLESFALMLLPKGGVAFAPGMSITHTGDVPDKVK